MIQFTKVRSVKSPVRANKTDSGIDFFVPNELEDIKYTDGGGIITEGKTLPITDYEGNQCLVVLPQQGILIPSGIKLLIEQGYDLVFENKSGVATKYMLTVGAKVVDSSYRGEVHLHLINNSKENVYIKYGQKIVQGIIRKVELCNPLEITNEEYEKHSKTNRGAGGFGSTGEA